MKYNKIIYFWTLLFVLPILYAIFINDSGIRNLNYVFVFLFIIYGLRIRIICNINEITFSKQSLITFFIISGCACLYSTLSQYYAFGLSAYDFSIFDSMIQATLQGNIAYSPVVGFYHFATHQNYILAF